MFCHCSDSVAINGRQNVHYLNAIVIYNASKMYTMVVYSDCTNCVVKPQFVHAT